MTVQRFRLGPRSTVESCLNQNREWVSKLSDDEMAFLSRELNDLLVNGGLIFAQSGSFASTRTIQVASETTIIVADFTQPTLLRKIFSIWDKR